jgi:hypothetical protein
MINFAGRKFRMEYRFPVENGGLCRCCWRAAMPRLAGDGRMADGRPQGPTACWPKL